MVQGDKVDLIRISLIKYVIKLLNYCHKSLTTQVIITTLKMAIVYDT